MASRKVVILRRPQSGRLEGPTSFDPIAVDFLTASFAGTTMTQKGKR